MYGLSSTVGLLGQADDRLPEPKWAAKQFPPNRYHRYSHQLTPSHSRPGISGEQVRLSLLNSYATPPNSGAMCIMDHGQPSRDLLGQDLSDGVLPCLATSAQRSVGRAGVNIFIFIF